MTLDTIDNTLAIEVKNLTYEFPNSKKIGLQDFNLAIPWGTTNLVVGPNGAGKSTLLRILAGKTLIKKGHLKLGGFDPFHFSSQRHEQANSDINNYITYLGTEWATNSIIKRDIPVNLLLASIGGETYQDRRNLLIDILDIDPSWSMLNISDGERRRVQIAMGLVKPWKLLLLDEVTIDLDVVVRSKLLNYLKQECQERNCTVVYATHIFDGLGHKWCDRVIHIDAGLKLNDVKIKDIEFVNDDGRVEVGDEKIIVSKAESLHPLALFWLNKDLERRGTRDDEKLKMNKRHNDYVNSRDGKYFDADDSKLAQYFKSTRSSK
ncbi:CCR4-NOT complex subunit CAF16 [Candida albicans P78048]|uniref:CCR4-NOT complex subunit CAF16 n=1 Tax=Candida albicans P78048 TaxID=1094989 RepID=A0AB34PY23_CANAX|nr:CCR4-NOT complex subunit CAF16 [Candida albicans P78048]KGR22479.1 CCR4-NOT complex subunit CAF16 [Candida albicans P37037]KGU16418.1 CCR4-NOT complex subunit CAF16 [Candida albicans 19F]KHC60148.1 CCR4-NOT complex subunit CAF16 [Candida albicans P37039]